jgi:hypothetical protein
MLEIIGLILGYLLLGVYVRYVAERHLGWDVEFRIAFAVFWPIVVAFSLITDFARFLYLIVVGELDSYDKDSWY